MPRRYTILQFEKQFPDDKACLEYHTTVSLPVD